MDWMRPGLSLTRRKFLRSASLGAMALLFPGRLTAGSRSTPFYVGTYTRGKSQGIYTCRMKEDGVMEVLGTTGGIRNPSFLAMSPGGHHLYAVSETAAFDGKETGSVSAFGVSAGELAPANTVSSEGTGPCHISVDKGGRFVLCANYSGGTIATIALNDDGSLGHVASVIQHSGSSVDPKRQTSPHPHQVVLDGRNNFAYVPDLGMDRIMIYRFDSSSGVLSPAGFSSVAPGSGPRHFAIHPDGDLAFVVCELTSTITSFTVDRNTGALTELRTISALPPAFEGTSYCAEIAVSGKCLYASNRGANTIAVIGIENGAITLLQQQSTLGAWPRNFALDPSGRFMLVANQNSGSLVLFSVDPESGLLSETGETLSIPDPTCVCFPL